MSSLEMSELRANVTRMFDDALFVRQDPLQLIAFFVSKRAMNAPGCVL